MLTPNTSTTNNQVAEIININKKMIKYLLTIEAILKLLSQGRSGEVNP